VRRIARYLPIVSWMPRYDRTWLPLDVIAGLTVWALVVPESMAYAGIAGVPVQYGLYAVPLAVLGYLVFGSSRQLFVGPSATVASISAVTVGAVVAARATGASVITLTAALSLLVGGLYLLGGLVRLGFIARFFAKPVLDGFIIGLGVYIAVGQVHKLAGIPSPSGDTVEILVRDILSLPSWQLWTAAVGFLSLAALFAMSRFAPRMPGALVVVVVSILATKALGLTAHGVAVVGSVPTGFSFAPWGSLTLDDLVGLLPGAMAVVIVGFAQSVAIAKAYAAKYGYRIDASQEMIGYGAANFGAGLLQGITVTGSLSKSGAAEEAGGKSPVLLAVVSVLVLLTILLLAGIFADLPEAVLAAVVIHAVSGMMRPTELVRLRRAQQAEFWLALGALLGVLVFGILAGIVVGVALSFVLLIRQLDHPHVGILGRDPGGRLFRDLATHPEFEPVPGALIYRFEAPLIFANAEIFTDDVLTRIAEADGQQPTALILDMETVAEVDTTGADALRALHDILAAKETRLVLARTTASVVGTLRRNGVLAVIGEANLYPSIADAVASHERARLVTRRL
jgi:high affinity sulfate transporter 1